MIIESILVVSFAIALDLLLGDPKNKFHPTVWVGKFIAFLVPLVKSNSTKKDILGGIVLVMIVTGTVATLLVILEAGLDQIQVEIIGIIISIIVGSILLKTTIAIRGMERHALDVLNSVEQNDLESARDKLALIVKRNTKNLDKNHVLSGVLESVSENTVDGVTGPLFYFGLFGLPGAFIYRAINTLDSMVAYRNKIFYNLGWFSATCDKIFNYLPARLTGIVMIFGSMILGYDWKRSYKIMFRDSSKLASPNAGFPMAALAGALGTKLEKVNHYEIGEGDLDLTKQHIKSALELMKVTSIMFCGIIVIPIIVLLSYLGWWIHA